MPDSLEELLERHSECVQKLFLRVMNLHAGYQINERTDPQLVGEIYSAVEDACRDGLIGAGSEDESDDL
jgi:hypothetical protein